MCQAKFCPLRGGPSSAARWIVETIITMGRPLFRDSTETGISLDTEITAGSFITQILRSTFSSQMIPSMHTRWPHVTGEDSAACARSISRRDVSRILMVEKSKIDLGIKCASACCQRPFALWAMRLALRLTLAAAAPTVLVDPVDVGFGRSQGGRLGRMLTRQPALLRGAAMHSAVRRGHLYQRDAPGPGPDLFREDVEPAVELRLLQASSRSWPPLGQGTAGFPNQKPT